MTPKLQGLYDSLLPWEGDAKNSCPSAGEGEAAGILSILTTCKHPLLLGIAAIRFYSSQCILKTSLEQAWAKGQLSRSLFLYYVRRSHIPLPLFSATVAAIKMQAVSSSLP